MQKMLSYVRRAVDHYHMIEDGDRIAVGVSGGKDSLALLVALAKLRAFYPKKFEVVAITLEMGYEEMDFSPVQTLCDELGVEYIRIPTQIKQIIFDVRQEENPCALCAKMRRGALHEAALAAGCKKVALGHHFDDVVETYMLSLFYECTNDYFTMDMYQAKDRLALVYRTQNWNYYQSFGMSANIPFNIGEWLSSQVNATVVNDRNRCDNFWDIPFNRKKWACMLAMQNHFSVGSNVGFDLDAMYRSSMISGISDTKPVFTVNVGAQWNFLKDKATLSLTCY